MHTNNSHEAKKRLAALIAERQSGQYKDLKKITFADFGKRWLENYAQGRVRASTLLRYRQLVELHLIPYFGNASLSSIGMEEVQMYLAQKSKEGTISNATINRSRTVLHAMMKQAVQWGYLRENPVQHVQPLKESKDEKQFLSIEEIERFLAAVPRTHYAFFLTAIFTGMRRGELLAMKWSNLDVNKKRYLVRESVYRSKFSKPKSKTSKRAVDLPPTVIEALKAHKVEQNKVRLASGHPWLDLDLIFPNSLGTPLDPGHLETRIFKPALQAGEIRKIRFHDLRHTNAALRIQSGEHPKRIQRQLGHASIQVTMDTYGHLMNETEPEAAVRLQNLVFKAG